MCATTLLAFVLSWASQAQPASDAQAELRKAWLKVCAKHAMDYRIYPTGKPREEFKFIPTPVFRHAQPTRGAGDIGSVWLWVQGDGRPAAVGTVFAFEAGQDYRWVAHEFHSLADEPLTAVWRGRERGHPPEPDSTGSRCRTPRRRRNRRSSGCGRFASCPAGSRPTASMVEAGGGSFG